MPFGLSVSSEIFCSQMDKALQGIPGTFPCADDVKIQGSTEQHHDLHLLETVARAKKAGLKFNPDKCAIKKKRIEYFGRIVSHEGVEPCPKKVKALMDLATPKDKHELQSFLGTVNFLANFIPNLSKSTHLMRGLLKKDVRFTWTSDMQKDMDHIKKAIATAVTLFHYDPNKPVVIETDASLKGLGAVLIQDGRPVRFLSKSLTPAESDYANIERELLAVLFACERLHVYTFGRQVTIHTDHKPLEAIFRKPISQAPARLQRMLLRLRSYDLVVKYVGANSVLIADTLSRLVRDGSSPPIPRLDISIAQVLSIEPSHLQKLQQATKEDQALITLHKFISIGWPESIQDVPEKIHAYWPFRDELTLLDSLIFKSNRVVVPDQMRPQFLIRLHEAHQGLSSTLHRARRCVFWPKIQKDIQDMIDKCEECQIHSKKKPRTVDRQLSAQKPMEIIGIDLMSFNGQHALVTVDYFSGYTTFDRIPSETTEAVVIALMRIFQKFGLAERIISDNGPCFKSSKFSDFCHQFEIQHSTSSPYHHQSNGRVERAIQTLRQFLKKTRGSQVKFTQALIAFHDTPISENLPSPAELFFQRRINTRLGAMLRPTHLSDSEKEELTHKRAAHLHPPRKSADDIYSEKQPVWFTDDTKKTWHPGRIAYKDEHPRSYWIIEHGQEKAAVRRNITHIKPRVEMQEQETPRRHILPESEDEAREADLNANLPEHQANQNEPDTRYEIMAPAASEDSASNDNQVIASPARTAASETSQPPSLTTPARHSRYGRQIKQPRRLDL